jgi:hypothetical protein
MGNRLLLPLLSLYFVASRFLCKCLKWISCKCPSMTSANPPSPKCSGTS